MQHECIRLQSYLNELNAAAVALNNELAPWTRRWSLTLDAIRITHDDGFFRGERRRVDSLRHIGPHDVAPHTYITVKATVIVLDQADIDRRRALFAELDRISVACGPQREKRRELNREIRWASDEIKRLKKAEQKNRQRKEKLL